MIARFVTLLLLSFLSACTGSNSNPAEMSLSGVFEATEVVLRAQTAGRVIQRRVDQGQKVARGELVAEIDHEKLDIRQAEIEVDLRLAEIQLRKAERELERTRKQVESRIQETVANLAHARSLYSRALAGEREEEIRRAAETLKEAKAALEDSKTSLQRSRQLYAQGVVSKERLDSDQFRHDQTLARYRAVENTLRMLEAGTRKEDIAAAKAQEEAARAESESARADLSLIALREEDVTLARSQIEKITRQHEYVKAQIRDAYVRAPISGTVAEKFIEVGEMVTEGMPIVSINDLSRVWLWVYVPEKDLGRIKLRDTARVKVDSFPDREFPGRVVFIRKEAEFTPKNIQTKEERVTLVFGVKIEVENPEEFLKPGLPGDAVLSRR